MQNLSNIRAVNRNYGTLIVRLAVGRPRSARAAVRAGPRSARAGAGRLSL